MMARLKVTLQVIGVTVLLICVVGNGLLGEWGNAAVALAAAVLLATA